MNAPLRSYAPSAHRFTLEEARRAWAAGVFADFPKMELIDGELIEMPADGPRTIDWNTALAERLYRALLDSPYAIVPDKTLPLPPHGGPSPDFYIHSRALKAAEVTGAEALLVIEVSDTTLDYDLDTKAKLYAKGGVREYWVVDCEDRRILVHRLETDGGYGAPVPYSGTETAHSAFVEGLAVTLADIDGLT